MASEPQPAAVRQHRWLAIGASHHPEEVAAWVESPQAAWQVVTEEGPEADRRVYTARLEEREDLPYWAYALAKAFLDDVGEWPLFGFMTEAALADYEDHGDPERAVDEILATVHPVWPEVRVRSIGRDGPEQAPRSGAGAGRHP
ncbi:MAG: hypothetical protein HQL82_06175 [Magnetococcales bacterium]|nr:hypothetical protein [Magnetococcales bacterium]